MKVSCIIPVYNVSRYLRKCVDSVLRQTHTDYEIILVNDCSTDNSAEICKAYREKYPEKVLFIDKPVNEGVDKARFTGLEHVIASNNHGGVMFIDSDDYIERDSLHKLTEEMIRTDCDVVQMSVNRVWGPISRPYYSPLPSQVIEQPELYDKYFLSFFGINLLDVCMCSKLYKVETIAKAHLTPTGFRMGEDLMFNMKLFPHYKRYALIDYRGYNYRVGGLTSRYNPTLWDDLKAQYFVKKEFALDNNYKKALRPLNIELTNILLTTICQRINDLHENDSELAQWLGNELENSELWYDMADLAKNEENPIYSEITEKNVNAIIDAAHRLLQANRMRRFLKKCISLVIK